MKDNKKQEMELKYSDLEFRPWSKSLKTLLATVQKFWLSLERFGGDVAGEKLWRLSIMLIGGAYTTNE